MYTQILLSECIRGANESHVKPADLITLAPQIYRDRNTAAASTAERMNELYEIFVSHKE